MMEPRTAQEGQEEPGAPALYRKLLLQLVAARLAAGGSLTMAEEILRTGEIDRVWVQMTEDEQDAFEQSRREPLP